MSDAQARKFADTYTVIAQSPPSITGFSGTVFQHIDGSLHIALRGTEPPSDPTAFFLDWITNIADLGADGIAVSQGIAMFNWLQRMLAAPGNAVVQYDINDGYFNGTTYVPPSITTATGTATGELVNFTGSTLSAAGHSLGGHLAMMLSRLAPTLVNSVYSYNAPGFDTVWKTLTLPLTSEGFFNLLQNAPIGPISGPIGTSWNSSIMTRTDVDGDEAHDIGHSPTAMLPAYQQIVFSETANTNWIAAHSINQITDSLALYNVFATLDPNLNITPATAIPKITDILKASANLRTKSLENTLDSLRTLFEENYTFSTADTYAAATLPVDDRNAFYTNLFNLEQRLKNSPLYNNATQRFNMTVDTLVNKPLTSLVTAAQSPTDYATRYALYKLNAFTIGGAGLYEAINANNDLDLYIPATRTGVLSEEYLKDRAAFLVSKIASGTANTQSNNKDWAKYTGLPQHFQDGTGPSAYHLYLGVSSSVVNQPTQNISNIIFDNWLTNTLTGGKGNDYLEGGNGRARRPELLGLFRKMKTIHHRCASRYENNNSIKEAA